MRGNPACSRLLLASVAITVLAALTAGCTTTGSTPTADTTGSIGALHNEVDARRDADTYGERYRTNPRDADAAIHYAQALRMTGQYAQAVAVLERTSLQDPKNRKLLGPYGRALADVGSYDQALDVLTRAHTPDQPDWRILSAQGAVLDQMGRHDEARRYYETALKIVPGEPSVLSNLGLSYALAKNLPKAEATLREAVARPSAAPRVRQNLALVVGLEGRFKEAEQIARADLPPDEAAANVAYLRAMLAQPNNWKKLGRQG